MKYKTTVLDDEYGLFRYWLAQSLNSRRERTTKMPELEVDVYFTLCD